MDERLGKRSPNAGFRDPGIVLRLRDGIAGLDPGREVRILHVCGTHENALCQYALRGILPRWLKLVAGPGCPVCVTPAAEIDMALRLALDGGATVATFGDVARVPARGTLLEARARGGDCRIVYGVEEAARIAGEEPGREVVFFAVGFETTACTTAALLRGGVPENFSVLCAHKLVPPALEALLSTEGPALDGFILPGHVATVTGLEPYEALSGARRVPMVVAGFEPVDILLAIHHLVRRIARGEGGVFNAYPRAVRRTGNAEARRAMAEVFEECEVSWRGIGKIPASGLRLRPSFAAQDARERFGVAPDPGLPDTQPGCRCGEILLGRVEPEECPLFGSACMPDNPVGPCMVAFEGTCHARFKHRRLAGAADCLSSGRMT